MSFVLSLQDVLRCHDIRNINSACQDDDDLRYFAYIALDEALGDHVCHVFSCDSVVRYLQHTYCT
jgi:hypothetical protein